MRIIFHKGFGTHHGYPGFDFEHDADGLHKISGEEQGHGRAVVAGLQRSGEQQVEVDKGGKQEGEGDSAGSP